jgi:hypothetical protein
MLARCPHGTGIECVHVMYVTVSQQYEAQMYTHDSRVFVPNVWQQMVSYFQPGVTSTSKESVIALRSLVIKSLYSSSEE